MRHDSFSRVWSDVRGDALVWVWPLLPKPKILRQTGLKPKWKISDYRYLSMDDNLVTGDETNLLVSWWTYRNMAGMIWLLVVSHHWYTVFFLQGEPWTFRGSNYHGENQTRREVSHWNQKSSTHKSVLGTVSRQTNTSKCYRNFNLQLQQNLHDYSLENGSK